MISSPVAETCAAATVRITSFVDILIAFQIHEAPIVKDTESISALTVAIGCGVAAALVGTAAVVFIVRQLFGKRTLSSYELLGESMPQKYRHQ